MPDAPISHELKTDPDVFDAVWDGRKTHEIRKDDRAGGFREYDLVNLRRTRHTGAEMAAGAPLIYTGQRVVAQVTHVLRGPLYGLVEGWAILSLGSRRNVSERPE